jgi:hypothetical protein
LRHGTVLGIIFPIFVEACEVLNYKTFELIKIGKAVFDVDNLTDLAIIYRKMTNRWKNP